MSSIKQDLLNISDNDEDITSVEQILELLEQILEGYTDIYSRRPIIEIIDFVQRHKDKPLYQILWFIHRHLDDDKRW